MDTQTEQAAQPAPAKRRWRAVVVTVVAVIAVTIAALAYVALSGHGSNLSRAQVSNAMVIAGNLRLALSEHFLDHKQWPKSLNEVTSMTGDKFVESVSITRGAGAAGEFEFTVTMDRQNSNEVIRGKTFLLRTNDGGASWICRAGTIEEKYLPTACRVP